MDWMNALIESLRESPWVLALVLLLVVVDGFFPPVPSESLVVALAAVGAVTGAPNPWAVLVVAALGSFLGDNIAFSLGRRMHPSRFGFLRGERAVALMARSRASLEDRPVALILTARFVPVGRVVVNALAGASRFPRRRFMGLTAVSGVAWAGYSIGIGLLAGTWIQANAVLGAGLAIVIALLLGIVVDWAGRRMARRLLVRRMRTAPGLLVGTAQATTK